jgi:ammonium transporter, Amt family
LFYTQTFTTQTENVKNILLKNLLDACGGALGFFTIGYGIAYGGDEVGKTFLGNGDFALRGFDPSDPDKGDDWSFFFFQFAFAATAATIVAGTVAERCKMAAYLCYSGTFFSFVDFPMISFLLCLLRSTLSHSCWSPPTFPVFLTAFVYPVIAHSIWSVNGFLSAFLNDGEKFQGQGTIDFAGSGVVHMTGGLTALIAAIILGPRRGRFTDDDGNPLEEVHTYPPHNVALQVLGTFILWFGWYGFNPASALKIQDQAYGDIASLAAVTTTMAAASGCVSCMFCDSIIEAMRTGHTSYDITMAMNGCLAGLVAITAGCPVIPPWAAIIVGAIGGLCYLGATKALVALRIDDAVDAIPVHFANGIWGIIAVGLFADETLMGRVGYANEHQGWFFEWGSGSGDAKLLIAQLAAVGWIIGWVTVLMTPFFLALNALGMFRVDDLEEEVGLDISHHRGAAYDLTAAKPEAVEALHASMHGGKVEVKELPVKKEEYATPAYKGDVASIGEEEA